MEAQVEMATSACLSGLEVAHVVRYVPFGVSALRRSTKRLLPPMSRIRPKRA